MSTPGFTSDNYSVTDQMGNNISVPVWPRRIISLVPSQTELLFDLGLEARIAGITKFCVHPKEKVKSKTLIGGTKNFNFEVIKELQPDLIIGNKEENYADGIRELQKYYPVWMSDIYSLADTLTMIQQVGSLTGTTPKATEIKKIIEKAFSQLPVYPKSRAAYFIWRNPYMVAASNTFIDTMLEQAGFTNAFATYSRYPQITPEELIAAAPEVIFLSSEPYPFAEKHLAEFKTICPGAKILVVDGELFSWPGSRLQYAPEYFKQLQANF